MVVTWQPVIHFKILEQGNVAATMWMQWGCFTTRWRRSAGEQSWIVFQGRMSGLNLNGEKQKGQHRRELTRFVLGVTKLPSLGKLSRHQKTERINRPSANKLPQLILSVCFLLITCTRSDQKVMKLVWLMHRLPISEYLGPFVSFDGMPDCASVRTKHC